MDCENLNSFYADAAVDLAGIRNGILIFIQDRKSVGELDPALRALNDMTAGARKLGLADTVDESFEKLQSAVSNAPGDPVEAEAFDIDEETLEIFRSEASELLENVSENLRILAAEPQNREAIWKIRRAAHTFKGAAG